MKSKKTKRALVSSALALVLCFVMLLGTTFAWFTDNASTSVNKVQAGTLDVALEMKEGEKWVSAEGKTLDFVKATDHEGETVLWEPGATYKLPELRIVNNGNLALKYEVYLKLTGTSSKTLGEVIDVKATVNNNGGDAVSLFKDADDNSIDSMTLNQVLSVGAVPASGSKGGIKGKLEANKSTEAISISMTMQQSAGNTYQGETIEGIAVTVVATQDTVEYDSNGNTYDEKAEYLIPWDGSDIETNLPSTKTDEGWTNGEYHVTTAAQLVGLMNQSQVCESGETHVYRGKKIILDCDIDLGGATVKGFGSSGAVFGGTFDGNGHTISNFTIDHTGSEYTSEYYTGLFNQVCGTVKDLTVSNARIIGKKMVGAIASNAETTAALIENCKVYDCTIIGTKKVGAVVGYTASGYVKNCYAENCTVYCADNSEDESGEVVGFINTTDAGCSDNTSGNTATNVTVTRGTTATFTLPTEAVEKDVLMADNISGAAQTKSIYNGTNGTKAGFVIANGTFDGNGNTLTVNSGDWGIQTSGGTVKNVTIEKAGRGIVINQPTADVSIENVTVTSCGYGINTAEHAAKNLYVSNSTIGGWSSWAGLASANFTNCKFVKGSYFNSDVFDQYLRPYITSTFTNCDFVKGMHFDLSKLVEDATVTFTNCTCNGVTLTADNVYNYLHVYLDNNDTEPTSADDLNGKLIFS